MHTDHVDQIDHARGLELRMHALEQTIEQMGEVLEHVRPKLLACVAALEAFEELQAMKAKGVHEDRVRDAQEQVVRLMADALQVVRGGA